MDKLYSCVCGKTFYKPNQFNSHKNHCTPHLENKYGSYELYLQRCNRNKPDKQFLLDQWIAEQHTCERCGKLMTEKFGAGRFCTRACANTRHHSTETKQKQRLASSSHYDLVHRPRFDLHKEDYLLNPKYCQVCNEVLPYERRTRKTCSDKCKRKLIGINSKLSAERHGGNNNVNGVRGTARFGTYKGFHCDSSFELAFVIYCLEHNIAIQRNIDGFDYIFEGKSKKYYPDFIVNETYVEIKNYWSEQVQAKIDQFPKQLKYKILYKEDLKNCIKYCIIKYGNDYTKLYDRTYPSWIDCHK